MLGSSAILIDGLEQDQVAVTDRALQYGDGLFETILVQDGRPCLWTRHWARLQRGARRFGLTLPSERTLVDESRRLIPGRDSGILKIILSRGSGGRGYRPPVVSRARRILSWHPLDSDDGAVAPEGVWVRHCETPVSVNPALAGLKHLNRLDSVLARCEWDDPEIAEGLMRDDRGAIVGGTMTNLFLWDGVALMTPPVDRAGIAGTVRELVIEMAERAGLRCDIRPLHAALLEDAAGLFLTNARVGAWPVRRLGDRDFEPARLPTAFLDAVRQAAKTPEWPRWVR